ncbi:MAG: MFS transporter [Eubacterium sp.]|nr:MFS transporter [Eubacterium sp.]
MKYSIDSIKQSRVVVIVLWLVYASAYFGRTCYSAAIASIVNDGIYSKADIGIVGTVFFVCYGVGQIVNGILGDRINPFKMVLFGAFLSGICCISIAFAESISAMSVIWGANGIFQSMLWSPLLRIYSETIHERLRHKAVLNIALSLPVGTVCSYLVSTFIIKYTSYKYVFISGGIVIFIMFLIAFLSFLSIRNGIAKERRAVLLSADNDAPEKTNLWKVILLSGLFVILVPSFLHGMMRDGITNWVPTMITEVYGVSPSLSTFLTIALPIFNAFGAYAVTPLYKKFGENEMKTAGATAAVALVPMLLLMLIGKVSVFVAVLLLALTTASMYALNYLIISRVPVRFASYSCTSSISGILNSFAYIGCSVSVYGFGAVSQKMGWTAVIMIWIVSGVFTSLFACLSNKKWKKFMD